MQKSVTRQAIPLRVAARIERLDAIARDCIAGSVSEIRAGVVHAEFRVIEDIENLRAELFSALRPALPNVSPCGAAKAAAFPSAGPKLLGLLAPRGALA